MGPLGEAFEKRARSASNLWYLTSAKAGGDIVLKSDAELVHCLRLEADPQVVSFGLHEPQFSAHSRDSAPFDFAIISKAGERRFQDVTSEHASEPVLLSDHALKIYQARERESVQQGGIYSRVGRSELLRFQMLAMNFLEGIAYRNAAAGLPLMKFRQELGALVRSHGRLSVSSLQKIFPSAEHPEVFAALFAMLANGDLGSDLDTHPWGKRTVVFAPAPPHQEAFESRDLPSLLAHELQRRRERRTLEDKRAMSAALAQLLPEGKRHHTRSTSPPELLDYRRWPGWSEECVAPQNKTWASVRREALIAYLNFQLTEPIAKETGIHRSELTRLFQRALEIDERDGQIAGWRILRKGYRPKITCRITSRDEGSQRNGHAYQFLALLSAHPEIRSELTNAILKRNRGFAESRVTVSSLHRRFLELCTKGGVSSASYPFNTKSQGLPALRELIKRIKIENAERVAELELQTGAVKRAKLDTGIRSIIDARNPYSVVAMDGHTLDFIGTVRIKTPTQSIWVPISRIIVYVVVDRRTWAILGYSVVIGGTGTAIEAMQAVIHALSTWEQINYPSALLSYAPEGGLPSGRIPELAGAGWSTLWLDNASNFTSEALAERVRRRVGCAVNYGPVKNWSRRFWVEGAFSALERSGFQRLPNTTGSHPKDPRRRDAESIAARMKIDWEELLYLIDVALANLNGTVRGNLHGRTPLQALRDFVDSEDSCFIPRKLPQLPPGVADLGTVVVKKTVRGNVAQMRRPYIEYLGVHYTSDLFSDCWELIGKVVICHISRDISSIKIFLSDGSCLGAIHAGLGWGGTYHDEHLRREVNSLIAEGKLTRNIDEDWPQAYLRAKTEQAYNEAVQRPKGNRKISKSATKVAKIAHKTGLSIPEILTDKVLPEVDATSPIEADGVRSRVMPSFVKALKRQAEY